MNEASVSDKLTELVQGPVRKHLPQIRVGDDDPRGIMIAGKYCAMIELCTAILALLRNKLGHHVDLELRSCFENYVDIVNLISDPQYLWCLQRSWLLDQRKMLLAAKGGNPYLRSISTVIDLDGELSRVGKQIKSLESRMQAKMPDIPQRFSRAGLSAEYEALYGRLSSTVHGGFSSVVRNNLTAGTERFSLGIRDIDDMEREPQLQSAYDALVRASVSVHTYFVTGFEGDFEALVETDMALQ